MIDLHSHVLPGLDDGAATIEESLAIASAAAADGVRMLAATPHVRCDFPTSVDAMRDALALVRGAIATTGIEVEIVPGGEIALDRLAELTIAEVEGFGLGGNPRALLIEFPYEGWPHDLAERLSGIFAAGIRPVLAHPERNADVQAGPSRLAHLVEAGALVQVTASSLTGQSGRTAARTARELVDQGLGHLVGSDTHRASGRRSRMSEARATLRSSALARWLTEDVPHAIVRGEDPPARPVTSRRKGRRPFAS